MKKFRYFILVLAGVAAMMLGGCKDKEKYDESAFQDDLEPLSEDEVEAMDQNGDDEMALIQIKMKWPSTFMSMAMYPPI